MVHIGELSKNGPIGVFIGTGISLGASKWDARPRTGTVKVLGANLTLVSRRVAEEAGVAFDHCSCSLSEVADCLDVPSHEKKHPRIFDNIAGFLEIPGNAKNFQK